MRITAAVILVACIAVPVAAAQQTSLPCDPVQRVATKALTEAYGVLEPWQREGYELCLAQDARIAGRALVTHYGPPRFKRGARVRYGIRLSERVVAAIMVDRTRREGLVPNRILWSGDYVLVRLSRGWELRQVLDTGAMSNWGKARRKGCTLWLDRWTGHQATKQRTWQCDFVPIRAHKPAYGRGEL